MTGPQPPRVLTLTPFYPHLKNLALGCFVAEPQALTERYGVENEVVAVQSWAEARRKRRNQATEQYPCRWVTYPSLPTRWGLPSAGYGLVLALNAYQQAWSKGTVGAVSLIHAHSALPCGFAAMTLAGKLGVPFVVSVHGLDAFADVQVTGAAGRWSASLAERVYAAAARVICVSRAVEQQVRQRMGDSVRTSVIYNGADSAVFAPVVAETLESSGLTVLSVGNLIPIKGHDLVIRAVAALQAEFCDLRFEIIGSGPEKRRLQALAHELHAPGQFLGQLSRAQVAERMSHCTVFALSSRYEALGCVYLEAMACGKPVIGCEGQGIAEVIEHGQNGWLVSPSADDSTAVTAALRALLRDPARCQQLGQAARRTVVDGFTGAQQAERLAALYAEVCAGEGQA